MAACGVGYAEQTADFYAIRRALKRLNHTDPRERDLALGAEAALDRLEAALAATAAEGLAKDRA